MICTYFGPLPDAAALSYGKNRKSLAKTRKTGYDNSTTEKEVTLCFKDLHPKP
jgi:hypothetical protein